jgi:hypothetical protein
MRTPLPVAELQRVLPSFHGLLRLHIYRTRPPQLAAETAPRVVQIQRREVSNSPKGTVGLTDMQYVTSKSTSE